MKDIFHDPEQMMMMDYADEADRKGLDIWEFSTLEELLDALRDADHDALFSASCDDDDYDDYDYYDVDKDDDDNDDDEDEDDDDDYNVGGYDVDDYDEDDEDEDDDEDDEDEVDSFYFDHVIASLSKPDLTAHTSLSSQPSPASQAAQTSQLTQSAQASQSGQVSQSARASQATQASQSVQASRGSQELPAPSRPVREPRRPEMPEPSSFIVFFFLYLVIMAMLILGSLQGLISYGRAESWKDWAVEIAAIIGLFVIPILLYVLNHKINMNDYKKNMEKYEAEMKVYEKRLEAYEKFTRGETADKGDFDKAGGPSQAQQDAQMKKALILMGSPRKNGNTASLAKPFISTLSEAGFHCETVWLCDLDIRPCLACRACQLNHTKAACVQQDDMTGLYDQVLACDLLILATPIYSWYLSLIHILSDSVAAKRIAKRIDLLDNLPVIPSFVGYLLCKQHIPESPLQAASRNIRHSIGILYRQLHISCVLFPKIHAADIQRILCKPAYVPLQSLFFQPLKQRLRSGLHHIGLIFFQQSLLRKHLKHGSRFRNDRFFSSPIQNPLVLPDGFS